MPLDILPRVVYHLIRRETDMTITIHTNEDRAEAAAAIRAEAAARAAAADAIRAELAAIKKAAAAARRSRSQAEKDADAAAQAEARAALKARNEHRSMGVYGDYD